MSVHDSSSPFRGIVPQGNPNRIHPAERRAGADFMAPADAVVTKAPLITPEGIKLARMELYSNVDKINDKLYAKLGPLSCLWLTKKETRALKQIEINDSTSSELEQKIIDLGDSSKLAEFLTDSITDDKMFHSIRKLFQPEEKVALTEARKGAKQKFIEDDKTAKYEEARSKSYNDRYNPKEIVIIRDGRFSSVSLKRKNPEMTPPADWRELGTKEEWAKNNWEPPETK